MPSAPQPNSLDITPAYKGYTAFRKYIPWK